MKRVRWMASLVLALAAGCTLLAACGGEDDDGGGAAASDGKAAATTAKGESAKVSSSTGSDADFVKGLCTLMKSFDEDLTNAQKTTSTKPEDPLEGFTGAFENMSAGFAKLNPPKDMADWHGKASKALNEAVTTMKKGDLAALQGMDNPIPEPPKDAEARLTKLIDNDANCKAASFNLGGATK